MVEFREKLFGFYIGAYTRKIEFNENFGREIFKKSFGWVLPQMVKKRAWNSGSFAFYAKQIVNTL